MRRAVSLVVAVLGFGTVVGGEEPSPHAPPPGQHLLGFYTGTLPCADCGGIHTELTLFAHGPTSSGTASYWLKETYLGKPDKDSTFEEGGSWIAQPGTHDPRSIVYHLTEARSRESRYYLKVSDNVLKMLDRSGRPIDSRLDYTLRRQEKAQAR